MARARAAAKATMRLLSRALLVVLLGITARSVASARQGVAPPPSAAGALSGVVVDGQTGHPVPGAVVSLGPASAASRGGSLGRQITDSRGRFAFTDVAPAELMLSASHVGYLDGGFSQTRAPGSSQQTFTLANDQWLADVRLVLWKPGAISGIVRDENGEACVGVEVRAVAIVRLAGRDHFAAGPTTMTDDRGAYRLAALGPGRYLVAVPSVQSSVSPFKTQADLNDMSDAQYVGAQSGSRLPLIVPTLETTGSTRVALGRYPIPPPPSHGAVLSYPLTFAPGVTDAKAATAVNIGFGEEHTGTDVQVAPVPAGDVRGRLEGPGQVANLLVRVMSVRDLAFGFETATARSGADGSFQIANVPAGSYTLDVSVRVQELRLGTAGLFQSAPPRPPGLGTFNGVINSVDGAPTALTMLAFSSGGATMIGRGGIRVTTDNAAALSARTEITVAAGTTSNVTVRLVPGGAITGQVRFDIPQGNRARLVADPADGNVALGQQSTGTVDGSPMPRFALNDLEPGRYFIRAAGGEWIVKSIQFNGREHVNTPLEVAPGQRLEIVVMLTAAGSTLEGTVSEESGRPASGVQVAAFPTDSSRWTDFGLSPADMRASPSSPTGTYKIAALPAGEYFVTAVPASWRDRWRDPEFFAAMASRATRVSVDWGETRTQPIKVNAP